MVEQANGEDDEDSGSLDGEQSGIALDGGIEDQEEVAQHSREEQKETLHETWRSRLRPRKSQGQLKT